MSEKVSVIGSGSWATAITKILLENGHEVHWWVRNEKNADHIRKFHHNPNYLSMVEFHLPDAHISSDLNKIISAANWVVLAVPSYYFADIIKNISGSEFENKNIVTAIKGIIQGDNLLISQYLNRNLKINWDRIANVSGPCHAEEVAAEKLSYLTFASHHTELAKQSAELFSNRFIKTHWSNDLCGTEYAAVLKNVYALAAGISVGLSYGDNFRAVLMSKAMQEIQSFLEHVLPGKRDILTSPYLGDTLVTAYSQHSRNRSFGLMIGRGYSVNAARMELKMVAEGYYSTKSLTEIANVSQIHLPILNSVYEILYAGADAETVFKLLSDMLN